MHKNIFKIISENFLLWVFKVISEIKANGLHFFFKKVTDSQAAKVCIYCLHTCTYAHVLCVARCIFLCICT